MEMAKKSRKVSTASFTKQSNIINKKLEDKPLPLVEVRALMNALEVKYDEIRNLDASIFEYMLVSDPSEEQLELETEVVDEYVSKFHLLKEQTNDFLKGTLLKLTAKALTRLLIRSQIC
ncbi:unnamed protein product [Psylliodes chrysocephalus]|uniref:Uncharacterized protein n=1 Tax=Psylliodes chrysocephalus TaxID=3402493 RepID=A0A9P0DE12_9CUCU|nr:unnamed protein product [Psylliodes chrysocephala]